MLVLFSDQHVASLATSTILAASLTKVSFQSYTRSKELCVMFLHAATTVQGSVNKRQDQGGPARVSLPGRRCGTPFLAATWGLAAVSKMS
jgi:hypothetical protein